MNIGSGPWFDFGVGMSYVWKRSSFEKWGISLIAVDNFLKTCGTFSAIHNTAEVHIIKSKYENTSKSMSSPLTSWPNYTIWEINFN